MTTLAADLDRAVMTGDEMDFLVVATDIIYQGAAVGLDASSGYARPLAAGDRFVGFNLFNRADNSAGAAGDIAVRVRVRGVVELPMSGLTQDDIGKPVWATDDNAFTLTNTADSCAIGRVVRLSARSGYAWVEYDAFRHAIDPITKIAAPTGGATTDAEARTAINSILTALEQHQILESN